MRQHATDVVNLIQRFFRAMVVGGSVSGRVLLKKDVAAVQTDMDGNPRFIRLTPSWPSRKKPSSTGRTRVWPALRMWSAMVGIASNRSRRWPHPMSAMPTGSGRQAAKRPGFRWVNTMQRNLKMSLVGTYHSFDHG